ncbi:MAG: hypothetical protein P4L44_01210 [Oryzomonas sp.]|uniref:hypothetical protein n=1 Tax=Oryzomonas sp. TaxID=2855186 RepID=UPI00284C8086|nr:hypothetical protein [Oryzomonas sp.]MDR3578560.1 hypothetical protein [Oryzomonas sp.]
MNPRSPFLLFLGLIMVLSGLAGCATVDQKIALNYAPLDRPFGRYDGEIAVSLAAPPSTVQNSKGEWIIGSINNVHGVHRADLLSDRPLGEWITDAMVLELKHAGYTVTSAPSLPAAVSRGILITDINVVLNVNKGLTSDQIKHELTFNVEVFLKGAKVKTFTVDSRDNSTLLTASRETKEKIMLQSLQDAMQQIIPDIIALIEKK